MLRLYFVALQFLAIIPIPFSFRCREEDLGRSMSFFPLVGLTLGLLLAGCDYLLALALPRPVADLLLVAILALVTGALHLDGLADVCDGLAARGGRERFLAVMKDSRVGAVGVVGLVLALLLKYQALFAVTTDKWETLLFFPMVARFSQVQLTVGSKRARQDGLGSLFIGGAGSMQVAVAAFFTVVTGWLLLGLPGIGCAAVCSLFTCLAKAWFHRKLGGITGDAIGCVSELNEILCLMTLVAIGGRF
ncbi:adenosylcobamide-5'-phosphate synthase [Geotalea daltonii FRC-32]|uniref:Adenosylcobinamide-GDP ribazoletransferase n=1 Tax=Geotalea daltonii (strain DSM 22248 / JCM 15807 / FRC-32) TaxID=316067 RepID=COBS_GEODF|nr:adenosylcobinamide-GDP ribazoletransferase [Geotalea daltonii]B9LZU3.1 RecName: Full=Adenosylcobinamide-GDP ribazoletransferase; AltName: Full=Cobalamin synthase; AltName: Full=Cobalamin-5'-phosphate synthase [Geotalea daltonii FRC-32]ACM18907.1 adenosylcobamide-5'-phosphate synthase [Geotalea daltonii FRC-32]